jgi:hypothetical protein
MLGLEPGAIISGIGQFHEQTILGGVPKDHGNRLLTPDLCSIVFSNSRLSHHFSPLRVA